MRYSLSRATSAVARLHRHGRVATEAEIVDAYQELSAARIERAISVGVPLDPERAAYLCALMHEHSMVNA